MSKDSKKPAIRFKGFTDDWEQRKFDDVFNYLAHNSLSRDDLNDNEGSIKNIHYGDVLIKFGNVIDTKHEYIPYVNDNVKLENKSCFLQDGDVVIADAAEDSTVGKCTEISESSDQKIVSGLHTIPCRPKNKFAKGFLGYYLNSNAYHDQLLPLMQGTKVSSISKTSLKETTIKFPSSIEEQKKVGACFHELDNLITLHQRKLDKLKNIKKALLEKMFPRNGENIPEVRFKGFSDDWEQRKLGDLANVYDGVHQTPDYKENGIMFLSVENITTLTSNKYISNEDFEKYYKIFPEKGDVLMTRIGDIGTPHVVESSEKIAYYVSLALLKLKNTDPYFLNNAIQTSLFQDDLKKHSLTTAIPMKINKDEIGKVNIVVTPNREEQKKIGQFFKSLDNLITLHQRKLDKLKNIKKALLEKMFV